MTFGRSPKRLESDRDATGSNQQIGDYYASYLDEARIDGLGIAPLKPYLAKIDGAKTRAQMSCDCS